MHGWLVRTVAALSLLSVQAALAAEVGNAASKSIELSALGDSMFRQSRFEDAEAAYTQALTLDPRNTRGHLGLARIATLMSDKDLAAKHISAAYQVEPRNPDVILAFADVVEDRNARQTLLRNFLALSTDERAQEVLAKLRIEEQVGSRKASVLDSPYQPYHLPLTQSGKTGLLLRARLNGVRELRLVVDTGASGVVLNASAARGLNLETLVPMALAGYGSGPIGMAQVTLASCFEVGGFKLSNPLVEVSQTEVTREADGIVGLDLFENFLIRMDTHERMLTLTPFTAEHNESLCADCVRTYRLGHLLLVRARVNGSADGYFILDSGAPYSLVSRKLLQRGEGSIREAKGIQGSQELQVPSAPVSIQLGNRHFFDFQYATLDTDEISARNGTEITGSIGLSMLLDLALTIDYRDGWVKLGKPGGEER
jgi:predicted aspartyl protease